MFQCCDDTAVNDQIGGHNPELLFGSVDHIQINLLADALIVDWAVIEWLNVAVRGLIAADRL